MTEEIRVRKRRGNFTTIPNAIIRDERLSIEARGLLVYIISLPENWKFRPRHLMKVCCIGRDKLYRLIGELKAAGYLVVELVKDAAGKFIGTNWDIIDEPCPEKPDTAEPESGKPDPLVKTDTLERKVLTPEPSPEIGDGASKAQMPSHSVEVSAAAEKSSRVEGHFEEFWRVHPNAADRPGSLRHFRSAVGRGVDAKSIINAARKYALELEAKGTPRQYWAKSVNWLDRRCWESYPEDPPKPSCSLLDVAEFWASKVRSGAFVPSSAIKAAVADLMIAECGITEDQLRKIGVPIREKVQ